MKLEVSEVLYNEPRLWNQPVSAFVSAFPVPGLGLGIHHLVHHAERHCLSSLQCPLRSDSFPYALFSGHRTCGSQLVQLRSQLRWEIFGTAAWSKWRSHNGPLSFCGLGFAVEQRHIHSHGRGGARESFDLLGLRPQAGCALKLYCVMFSRKHGEGFFRWVHGSYHESHCKELSSSLSSESLHRVIAQSLLIRVLHSILLFLRG